MIRTRHLPAAIALAVALAGSLAGCSVSIAPGAAPGTTLSAASTRPGADPETPDPAGTTPEPSDPAAGDGVTPTPTDPAVSAADDALPPAFPLPDGATVAGGAREADQLAATVTVTDGGAAYAFWRRSLAGAGYTVTHSESAFGLGEIRYRGHGCGGDSQIAITGTTAAVQCDLG